MSESSILVLDLETTGLDPKRDIILECAALIVDLESLEIVRGPFSWIRTLPKGCTDLGLSMMSNHVREMHEKSGLLAILRAKESGGYKVTSLDECLLAWLTETEIKPGQLKLCGFSPHFDEQFLMEWCPMVHGALHYKNINVSSLRDVLRLWGICEVKKGESNHRALDDCNAVIEDMKAMRDHLRMLAIVPSDEENENPLAFDRSTVL